MNTMFKTKVQYLVLAKHNKILRMPAIYWALCLDI
jgi:hypothetical protein